VSQLYLWSVARHDRGGWDTFSDFAVCCATEQEARDTHPGEGNSEWITRTRYRGESWINPNERHLLVVELLGTAKADLAAGLICASFHSG
jgi:hypothetical protein